ncbi:MAG: ATP-binding cassette domain-containing protein [Polyangiales bacterium]
MQQDPLAEIMHATERVGVAASLRAAAEQVHSAAPSGMPWRVMCALMFVVLGPLANVFAPVILGVGVDALMASHEPLHWGSDFIGYAALYTLVAILSNCTPALRDMVFAPVLEGTLAHALAAAHRHVLSLSLDFHHSKRIGALTALIERGVRAIEVLIRGAVFQVAPTLFELVLALVVMAQRMALRYSLTALVGAGVYLLLIRRSSHARLERRRRQNEHSVRASGIALDALGHYETVKLFGAEDHVLARYQAALGDHATAAVATNLAISRDTTLQHTVMRLTLALVIVMAGAGIAAGELGVGELFTGLLLIKGLFSPLGALGQAYRELQQATVDLAHLRRLEALIPDIQDAPAAQDLPASDARGVEIVFEQVGHRHASQSAGGLHAVSFSVKPGQTLAVVGASGAGKTTLARLLVRLLDPHTGSIRLNGVDLRTLTNASLRAAVAVVPQDVALFNDTLLANLTLRQPTAALTAVRAAVEAAELGPLVARLPHGFSTLVGERGWKLSGGERQRVGIARALLADPRLLVLDEATSALDGLTEGQIQAALRRASVGRTSVIVAHRLSTIVGADHILVLRAGQIIESGTHGELLRRDGHYAALWRRQTDERTTQQDVALVS